MLSEAPESRSLSINARNENGEVVLASHGNYAPRHISISFDLLDREYCLAHRADVEAAMSAFLSRFNELLAEAELPQVGS